MIERSVSSFDEWRAHARTLLSLKVLPCDVVWNAPNQASLFNDPLPLHQKSNAPLHVPKDFIECAKAASCFRGDEKWGLLYRILWRLCFEEKHLLKISTDDDIHKMKMMIKQVRRDAHKMKAFVRFREVSNEPNTYVAWHEPVHLIVERTAPFFMRRFTTMNWSILTPDTCAHWNGNNLTFSKGVTRAHAPDKDDMEELWKTFYRHIFNPARIKMKMMKSEMPVKYWHTMPETALIPSMLEEADKRVQMMLDASRAEKHEEPNEDGLKQRLR